MSLVQIRSQTDTNCIAAKSNSYFSAVISFSKSTKIAQWLGAKLLVLSSSRCSGDFPRSSLL